MSEVLPVLTVTVVGLLVKGFFCMVIWLYATRGIDRVSVSSDPALFNVFLGGEKQPGEDASPCLLQPEPQELV